MWVQKARKSRSGSASLRRCSARRSGGRGVQLLHPPGTGQLVHIGGDAVDHRAHPREVNGHVGRVRPVGGGAQQDSRSSAMQCSPASGLARVCRMATR